MADRPYRTYKGGRVRPEPEREPAAAQAVAAPERRGAIELPAADAPPPIEPPRLGRLGRFGRRRPEGWTPSRRAPRGLRFWIKLGVALVALLVGLWLVLGLLAVRSSVSQANERLDPRAPAALAAPDGSILAVPTSVLVIGVDENANSDTLQVIRFDPGDSLVATLSIPRDLRVAVPGYGEEKINAAYASGGAPLALRTVQDYTGLEVDHVIVLDFDGLVIDTEGFETRVAGVPIALTPQEFALLRHLSSVVGRVQTREALLQRVWGRAYAGGVRTVDIHIQRLRSKLGDPHQQRIVTVRGVGYKWAEARRT